MRGRGRGKPRNSAPFSNPKPNTSNSGPPSATPASNAVGTNKSKPVRRQFVPKEPPVLFPKSEDVTNNFGQNIWFLDPPDYKTEDNFLLRKNAELKQRFVLSPFHLNIVTKKTDIERYSDRYIHQQVQPDLFGVVDSKSLPRDLVDDKRRKRPPPVDKMVDETSSKKKRRQERRKKRKQPKRRTQRIKLKKKNLLNKMKAKILQRTLIVP